MFIMIGLFFVTLLSMILFMLYRSERTNTKNNRHHAMVEECWTGRDRRKHTRFKKSLDVIYAVSKKPHLKSSGRTLDISEGGMRMLLDEKHPTGTIMSLKTSISPTVPEVEIEGKVVWCKESPSAASSNKRMFEHGLEFMAIKEPSGKHLSDYICSISTQSPDTKE